MVQWPDDSLFRENTGLTGIIREENSFRAGPTHSTVSRRGEPDQMVEPTEKVSAERRPGGISIRKGKN